MDESNSSKEKIYDVLISPLLDHILSICIENRIPMLSAFCLQQVKHPDGKVGIMVAGTHNLDDELDPPPPMIYAAITMKIPGFAMEEEEE